MTGGELDAGPTRGGSDDCSTPEVTITTTRGTEVWIPSSLSAGPFQFGGSQQLSTEDGTLTSKTKGRASTVGGSAGVSFKVFEASGEYNRERSSSTTTETSMSQTFTTNSEKVARKVHWRWRMYRAGVKFTATKTVKIPAPCINASTKTRRMTVIVPFKAKLYTFAIERYAKRNMPLNSKGKPVTWR